MGEASTLAQELAKTADARQGGRHSDPKFPARQGARQNGRAASSLSDLARTKRFALRVRLGSCYSKVLIRLGLRGYRR